MTGMRHNSQFSLYHDFMINIRRMLLLYLAMFLPTWLTLNVMTFLVTCLISLIYLLNFKPFESPQENKIRIFNELILLLVAYLVKSVAAFENGSEQAGLFIVYIIWFSLGVNLIVVVYSLLCEVYLNLRRLYLRRQNRLAIKEKMKEQSAKDKSEISLPSAFKSRNSSNVGDNSGNANSSY